VNASVIEKHFTILIPAYNCSDWVDGNLASALQQDYDNYDVVYVDDASTDNTFEKAKAVLESSDKKFKLVKNNINVRALSNLYSEISKAKEDTIIITLDGDDRLAGRDVLKFLNSLYQDDNVWLTAGSYVENDTYNVVSPIIPGDYWSGNIRKKPWSFSHLRTFRKKLFDKIRVEDMLDTDGNFYKFTFDRVMMYPMVEMAGAEHTRLVGEVLYLYNRMNPISVDRAHRSQQLRIESVICNKSPYNRVKEL